MLTESSGEGSADVYLVKTDSSGNLVWEKTFGGTGWDYGNSVKATGDGGYIIAGYTKPSGAAHEDVYIIKTDSSGNLVWETTFGGADSDYSYDVQVTGDGGYIIAGTTLSSGAGFADVYLVKTDSSGNLVWEKTFGYDLLLVAVFEHSPLLILGLSLNLSILFWLNFSFLNC